MLIEFSVANYRSFLERQTLSMVAGSVRDHGAQHSFETKDRAVPRLLRSAAVYGPNAAGKSNLVQALHLFQEFVIKSAKEKQEGEKIDIIPFRLTKKSLREPSEFEAIFIMNGNRYQYGFSVNEKRICEEWLFAIPQGGRKQRWFERTYNTDAEYYEWYINPALKGNRRIWKESTRDNALFLSTAVQLNSEPLLEPFSWFFDKLRVLPSTGRLLNSYTVLQCYESEKKKEEILRFLTAADLGILDIIVHEKEFSTAKSSSKYYDVLTKHIDFDGDEVFFPLIDESDGTQVIFSLAGPWLNVLEGGAVIVVDELHNSLHPHMLRFLVNWIHDKECNPNKAQLIFTSHDTSLMSGDFMGRDQFWLVEKNKGQASELTPLLDYKPRKGEALEKGYLGGRYGALPKIKELA